MVTRLRSPLGSFIQTPFKAFETADEKPSVPTGIDMVDAGSSVINDCSVGVVNVLRFQGDDGTLTPPRYFKGFMTPPIDPVTRQVLETLTFTTPNATVYPVNQSVPTTDPACLVSITSNVWVRVVDIRSPASREQDLEIEVFTDINNPDPNIVAGLWQFDWVLA